MASPSSQPPSGPAALRPPSGPRLSSTPNATVSRLPTGPSANRSRGRGGFSASHSFGTKLAEAAAAQRQQQQQFHHPVVPPLHRPTTPIGRVAPLRQAPPFFSQPPLPPPPITYTPSPILNSPYSHALPRPPLAPYPPLPPEEPAPPPPPWEIPPPPPADPISLDNPFTEIQDSKGTMVERMDYVCTYDPALDSSVVKKGATATFRHSKPHKMINSRPHLDPRLALAPPLPPGNINPDPALLLAVSLASAGRQIQRNHLQVLAEYSWDKNSTGEAPPLPPSALAISSLDRLVSVDQVRTYFSQYGRLAECEIRLDPFTGGSLGICWIRFQDDLTLHDLRDRERKASASRQLQDGHKVAKEALKKSRGAKLGVMLVDSSSKGIVCHLDGDGTMCKRLVDLEVKRLHPAAFAKDLPSEVQSLASQDARLGLGAPPPSVALTSTTSTSTPPDSSVLIEPGATPSALTNDPLQAFKEQQVNLAKQAAAAGLVPTMPSAMRQKLAAQQAGIPLAAAAPQAGARPPLPISQPLPVPPASGPSTTQHGPFGGPAPSQGPQLLRSASLSFKQPVVNGSLRLPPGRSKIAAGFVAAAQRAAAATAAASGLQMYPNNVIFAPPIRLGPKGERLDLIERQATEAPANGGHTEAEHSSRSDDTSESEDEDAKAEREKEVEREALIRSKRSATGRPVVSAVKPAGVSITPAIDSPKKTVEFETPQLTPGGDQKAKLEILRRLSVNGKKYLTIDRSYLGALEMGVRAQYGPLELKRHFGVYRAEQVMTDGQIWYITFFMPDTAERAHSALNKKTFMGFPIPMVLKNPVSRSGYFTLIRQLAPPEPVQAIGPSDTDLVRQARGIIMKDLRAVLAKDLKTRLITGKVWEMLKAEQRRVTSRREDSVYVKGGLTGLAADSNAELKSALKLPTFAKRRSAPRCTSLDFSSRSDQPGQRREIDGRREGHQQPDPSLASDDDDGFSPADGVKATKAKKLKKKPRRTRAITWTSSEDEGSNPPPAPPMDSKGTAQTAANQDNDASPLVDETDERLRREAASFAEVLAKVQNRNKQTVVAHSTLQSVAFKRGASDLNGAENQRDGGTKKPRLQKSRVANPIRIYRGRTPDPFEYHVAEDEEDLYYARVALTRLRYENNLHPEPRDGTPSAEECTPNDSISHSTGSARAEGYYPVTSAQKAAYLPQRNKAIVDVSSANTALAVSRSARVNSRRFVLNMEQHKKASATPDTDVLKFNQLRSRKKQLRFARSPIHDWGLYAMESIPVGEMVIEYVGEVIRQAVADRREKVYERMGIGSSYLFRVDDDLVVDATKKGNLGRLINHCCSPNCTAKIITINGEKKIVIYAKATIEAGDEVTYDYHFPKEDVKIPCLCGSSKCKGTLN